MPRPFRVLNANSAPDSGMGANLLSGGRGASFRVWAPNASDVQALLRANSGEDYVRLPLTRDPTNKEYFSAELSGVQAEDEYRFEITNVGMGADNPGGLFGRIDPYTRDVDTSDANAPGFVVVPGGRFVPFGVPHFEDFLIYQLHIGSFAGLNDGVLVENRTATFKQIADNKLDYIQKMNFNAVAFLPTTQNPPKEREGYAPTNFFSPEVDYGDPEDLRFLVDQCHRRGLAVIFDAVYNHVVSTDSLNRLLQFDGNTVNNGRGVYFSDRDNFGPVPDFDRVEIRNFFIDNARQCFNEFDGDGIRFDSAHAIVGRLRGVSVMSDMLAAIKADFPDKFLIAEHVDSPFAINQLGFDACWAMNIADDFVNTIANGPLSSVEALVSHFGLPHGFNTVRYLLGSHDQIFANYDRKNGTVTTDKPNNRYFVERVGGVTVGRDNWIARAKARMGWVLNVAMPCTPMMFMGAECHHHGYWNSVLDANPGDHRFDFALTKDAIGQQMIAMVSDANRLRWDHPALRSDNLLITHRDPVNRVLGFKRWNEQGDVLLVLVNMSDNQFSEATYGVGVGGDGGSWEEIFNSQAPQYGGFNDSGNFLADLVVGGDNQIRIRLPKWSTLVFRRK